jgi:hypothetical protein
MVIYDPNKKIYNPAWSSSNKLILKPIIYYGGQQIESKKATVTWTYKTESVGPSGLGNYATITADNFLEISNNLFTILSTKLLTYPQKI